MNWITSGNIKYEDFHEIPNSYNQEHNRPSELIKIKENMDTDCAIERIITQLREVVINTITSNWKNSIDSLNYRIGTISSAEYIEYSEAINRIYATGIASIAQEISNSVIDKPEQSQSNTEQSQSSKWPPTKEDISELTSSVLGMLFNNSNNGST